MEEYYKNLLTVTRCSACEGVLSFYENKFLCSRCQTKFLFQGEKIFFINPPVDIKITSELSWKQKIKEEWTDWRKSNYTFFKNELQKFNKDSTVLDFGVGPAQFAELVQNKFSRVVGVDFFPYKDANVVCDLTKPLPFKNNAFDVIVASNIFEHLPNTLEILNECFRILKPGGGLIGTIPFLLRIHQAPYDFHRYTYFMLEKILKEANFTNNRVISLGSSFNLYKLLQRHFFYLLFEAKLNTNSRLLKKGWFYSVKILWNMHKLLNFAGKPFFEKSANTPNYTAGYGFLGSKPK